MGDRTPGCTRFISVMLTCVVLAGPAGQARPRAQAPAGTPAQTDSKAASQPQPRKSRVRVPVDPQRVEIDDGDTVFIHWQPNDREDVRIIGIDTPETQHLPHNIPYAQPFGDEARGFASGAFAAATSIELLRAPTLDPYGRTLGYLFLNGKNYSVMVIAARLAEESVTQFGDNGFPEEAAAVMKAARAAGPLPAVRVTGELPAAHAQCVGLDEGARCVSVDAIARASFLRLSAAAPRRFCCGSPAVLLRFWSLRPTFVLPPAGFRRSPPGRRPERQSGRPSARSAARRTPVRRWPWPCPWCHRNR